MLEAAKEIIKFSQGKSRSDLEKDPILELALVRLTEIIGEAATRISKDFRDKFSSIPWENIIGMRNRVVHAYYDINLDRVWDTITDDIPSLITELEKITSTGEKA